MAVDLAQKNIYLLFILKVIVYNKHPYFSEFLRKQNFHHLHIHHGPQNIALRR